VLKALEPLLDDPDTNMQTSAAEAYCAWATKENGPTLVKFLKNERLRGRAIEALTRLKDERAIGPISECLSGFVGQGEAKAALIAFGPAAEDVVLKLFEHSDHRVRAIACEIAQKTKSARAIDPIAECIVHTDSRNQASEALVAFGSMAEDAVIKLLGQSDPNVRALACEMLIKIGTQKCLPALEQTTQDLDRNVNTTAKNALLQITKRLSGAPG
jgi:HEAT repeat protein